MRKDVPYSRNLAVDAGNAIEWDHPDNAGLKLWVCGLPGTVTAGGVLNNLVNANQFQCVWQAQTPSSPIWKTNRFDGAVGFGQDSTQTQHGLISSGPIIGSATGFSIFGSVRVDAVPTSDWPLYCERAAAGNNLVRFGVAQGGTRNGSASVAYRSDAAILQQPCGTTEINSNVNTATRGLLWARIGLILSNGFFYVSVNGVVESVTALSGSTTMTDSGRRCFINGDNASGGRLIGESSNIRLTVGTIMDPIGYTRRDYAWCRTPQSDPRIRWFSTRSCSLPGGGGTNRRRRIICGGD
jgi:hypothetical protein